MGKPNRRRVRMQQFKSQVSEHMLGEDGLIPVDLNDDVTLYLKVALYPIDTDGDDYVERMKAAADIRGMALVALSYSPEIPEEHVDERHAFAEQQWRQFLEAGYTEKDFITLLNTETADARERLGKFKYTG